MIASSLFVAVIVLGAPFGGHDRAPVLSANAGVTPSHLVVPTGVAVPVERTNAAPSDLFRTQRCAIDPARFVVVDHPLRASGGTS